MNEQIVATALAIATTIIGGIFGFVLSEISTRRRELREDKRQAQSVRAILNIEIERNLTALQTFWEDVIQHDYETGDKNRRARDLARELVATPLAAFSREAFRSQLSLMARSLRPQEIAPVFRLYDDLGKLETIRRELADTLADQNQEMAKFRASQSAPGAPGGILYAPRTPFDNKSAQVWDEVETLAKQALAAGNPLK